MKSSIAKARRVLARGTSRRFSKRSSGNRRCEGRYSAMKLCRTIGILFGISSIPLAQACCLAYGQDPMSLIDEKAIIVWNPKTQMEHFIRQASFEGKAKDFGFIVPTPSQPQVEEADAAAFERLQKLVPKPSTRGMDAASTPAGGFGGVEILEQKRVGDYF